MHKSLKSIQNQLLTRDIYYEISVGSTISIMEHPLVLTYQLWNGFLNPSFCSKSPRINVKSAYIANT